MLVAIKNLMNLILQKEIIIYLKKILVFTIITNIFQIFLIGKNMNILIRCHLLIVIVNLILQHLQKI